MTRSDRLSRPTISRRHFLALSGGIVLAGCAGTTDRRATTGAATTGTVPSSTVPSSVPTTVTTVDVAPDVVPDGRVLVLVELAGGNDAVNTLVPMAGAAAGAYRDLRPTLGLDEGVPVALGDGYGLHPSLAPLTGLSSRLATVAGIGFSDPDRSHFVSFDRWWRADRVDESMGWLGRWLDTLPSDALGPLGATAVGRGSPVLRATSSSSTTIADASAFALPHLIGANMVSGFSTGGSAGDPVLDAARHAWRSTNAAVAEFARVAAASVAEEPVDGYVDEMAIAATTGFQSGLSLAAEIVTGDVGARVVVVSVGGFDTHSRQLDTHAALLADLAVGIERFWAAIDAAGLSDRVLMMTQSEFGRRVAENGSEGTDHGAAGVSFVLGNAVATGIHGILDLTGLLDGDVRPVHDPRALFTVALDWLGGDAERILGQRHEGLPLLA
jgi:uncharacterized protein (DUF1501 family)